MLRGAKVLSLALLLVVVGWDVLVARGDLAVLTRHWGQSPVLPVVLLTVTAALCLLDALPREHRPGGWTSARLVSLSVLLVVLASDLAAVGWGIPSLWRARARRASTPL